MLALIASSAELVIQLSCIDPIMRLFRLGRNLVKLRFDFKLGGRCRQRFTEIFNQMCSMFAGFKRIAPNYDLGDGLESGVPDRAGGV